MMKLFYKMLTSCSTVGLSTYTVLLRNLLVAGRWRKYVEVLQWMEDAGVRPTLYMYLFHISGETIAWTMSLSCKKK
uniref:Pentatricopeptide repeat-containing protein n=1 Tax=Arundo donax TaxID=35708 RepID=A0A0A9H6S0_ARUDO